METSTRNWKKAEIKSLKRKKESEKMKHYYSDPGNCSREESDASVQ